MNLAMILDQRPDDAAEELLVRRAALGHRVVAEALYELRNGRKQPGDAAPQSCEHQVGMSRIIAHHMKYLAGRKPLLDRLPLANIEHRIAVADHEPHHARIVESKEPPEKSVRKPRWPRHQLDLGPRFGECIA